MWPSLCIRCTLLALCILFYIILYKQGWDWDVWKKYQIFDTFSHMWQGNFFLFFIGKEWADVALSCWSSNSKQNRTTKWNLQMEIFAHFPCFQTSLHLRFGSPLMDKRVDNQAKEPWACQPASVKAVWTQIFTRKHENISRDRKTQG